MELTLPPPLAARSANAENVADGAGDMSEVAGGTSDVAVSPSNASGNAADLSASMKRSGGLPPCGLPPPTPISRGANSKKGTHDIAAAAATSEEDAHGEVDEDEAAFLKQLEGRSSSWLKDMRRKMDDVPKKYY